MLKPTRSSRMHTAVSSSPSQRGRAKKISLTVDEAVLSAMEREAKKSKRTLSGEITEALARELRRRRLQELVAGYEQKEGTITAKELAKIQAEWLE